MTPVNGSNTDEQLAKSEDAARATAEPTSDGAAVLELRDVSCAYEAARPAVEDISFRVQQGEMLCLLGPSGCGKTTILRAIAGFERITNGTITLSGRLVSSPDTLVPTEQRHIGMVFQEYALFPHLRVDKNIAFGLNHLSLPQQRAIVDDLLALTGLCGLEHRYPHELSGGQQQRVALARALALRPVLLLLDEPFSNLDPDMASRMRQELHALLRQTKTTAILVTHDHDEAFSMADHVAVLNRGRLEQFDTPEAIYHLPTTPFVADFVGQADFVSGVVADHVVTTELGDFPNTQKLATGSKVVVMIRPDDIHIVPTKGANARIVARQFKGSENVYTIRLASGQTVHSSESSLSIYQVGTAIALRVVATHTVLFPHSPESPAEPGSLNGHASIP
ncbi:MAG TPA: ABC transporter ATP-binding protein [Nitrospira sp.]|nr:ABC transporter ATP-binding protein [Nitrospira sp.]